MDAAPREHIPQQDRTPIPPGIDQLLSGVLHVFVAFDWGEEVDLEKASRLAPAEVSDLPRRRRTPASIVYRSPPLRFALNPVAHLFPGVAADPVCVDVKLFDFGGVSACWKVPFSLSLASLTRLAGWLATPGPVIEATRKAVTPLHEQLLPCISRPQWKEALSEEYFVFQFFPGAPLAPPEALLREKADWLASLVRLEEGPLSSEEIVEALRLHLSYSPEDLFVPDWAAGVLIDKDCEESLQTIEFGNLQLLEYRHIDDRLDDSLADVYRLVAPATRTWFPFLRSHARSLRFLGGLKVDAENLFERTGNVFKLVGDQYLARVHRLIAARFHLQDWEQSIQRKLEVDEGVYQILSDQAAIYRTEVLEAIVIALIGLEIVLTFFRH